MDSRLLTQHYTLLIIFTLSERGGGNSTKMRREHGRRKTKREEEEGGERRQWRRVRKPQITTINHQAVNIFHMLGLPVIGSSQGSVRVCTVCFVHMRVQCVCVFAPSCPAGRRSLSHCLRLAVNWRHKQQQLRNHPRQQEAGRCVNSPSTKLGCARLQKSPRLSYLAF